MHRHLSTLFGLLLCGQSIAADVSVLVTDSSGKPLAHAVVTLSGNSLTPNPQRGKAEITQINTQFDPHVLIIPRDTRVSFPNLDNTRHQVYSFSPIKRFTTNLFAGREAEPVDFDQAGLVPIGCNIHDRMHAYIYVTDAPRFAVTGADGTARFDGLTPGAYKVEALHPWQTRQGLMALDVRVRRANQSVDHTINLGQIGQDPRLPRRQTTNPLIRSNPFAR